MLDRFREGSSFAGIAAIAGTTLPALGVAQPLVAAITALFGAIAFLLKDKK